MRDSSLGDEARHTQSTSSVAAPTRTSLRSRADSRLGAQPTSPPLPPSPMTRLARGGRCATDSRSRSPPRAPRGVICPISSSAAAPIGPPCLADLSILAGASPLMIDCRATTGDAVLIGSNPFARRPAPGADSPSAALPLGAPPPAAASRSCAAYCKEATSAWRRAISSFSSLACSRSLSALAPCTAFCSSRRLASSWFT